MLLHRKSSSGLPLVILPYYTRFSTYQSLELDHSFALYSDTYEILLVYGPPKTTHICFPT